MEAECKQMVEKFGEEPQLLIVMEELAELIQAISHKLRNREHNIEEELVDVEIMLIQLNSMSFIDKDKIHAFRRSKGDNLINMLVGEKQCRGE